MSARTGGSGQHAQRRLQIRTVMSNKRYKLISTPGNSLSASGNSCVSDRLPPYDCQELGGSLTNQLERIFQKRDSAGLMILTAEGEVLCFNASARDILLKTATAAARHKPLGGAMGTRLPYRRDPDQPSRSSWTGIAHMNPGGPAMPPSRCAHLRHLVANRSMIYLTCSTW